MRSSGIYEIRNMVSGRVYVGSATIISRRFAQHKCDLRKGRHHSRLLQNSWNKHGEDAFRFSVIELCDPGSLAIREAFWMKERHATSAKLGFNLRLDATSNSGIKRSDQVVAAMRGRMVGRVRSLDERKRISEALVGRPVSNETREKLAAGRRGRVASPETRKKISESNAARRDDVREKMKASSARRWSDPEERERYREIGRRLAHLRWGSRNALQKT